MNQNPDLDLLQFYADYDEDEYDEMERALLLHQYHHSQQEPFVETYFCLSSSSEALFTLIKPLILLAVLQRAIFCIGPKNRNWQHGSVALLGIGYFLYNRSTSTCIIALLVYFVISYFFIIFIRLSKITQQPTVCFGLLAGSIFYILLCQQLTSPSEFTSFRGSLMVVVMKIVSVAFDLADGTQKEVNVYQIAGYVFNPATSYFGLFTTFEAYLQVHRKFLPSLKSGLLISGFFGVMAACFFYSACLIPQISNLLGGKAWIIDDYFTAQSFRFDQYFILYFLWHLALVAGYRNTSLRVVNAIDVEWPRSMTQVVVSWNAALSDFLNIYVYKKIKSTNITLAVLSTFVVSSLMHGLTFQITSVLLSLAFFALAENAFRKRLARRLNLCILSRRCQSSCTHNRSANSVLVRLATIGLNLAFTFANILLLIYTGMAFTGDLDLAEVDYSAKHALAHYGRYNFAGHVYALGLLVLSFVI